MPFKQLLIERCHLAFVARSAFCRVSSTLASNNRLNRTPPYSNIYIYVITQLRILLLLAPELHWALETPLHHAPQLRLVVGVAGVPDQPL